VAVEFHDTGPGISDEQRRRAFSSVLRSTKIRGTGLGLAIVGRIIEAHRGKIKIKSRAGTGTVITILLPT
jgi:signal transduction histidine kinase